MPLTAAAREVACAPLDHLSSRRARASGGAHPMPEDVLGSLRQDRRLRAHCRLGRSASVVSAHYHGAGALAELLMTPSIRGCSRLFTAWVRRRGRIARSSSPSTVRPRDAVTTAAPTSPPPHLRLRHDQPRLSTLRGGGYRLSSSSQSVLAPRTQELLGACHVLPKCLMFHNLRHMQAC